MVSRLTVGQAELEKPTATQFPGAMAMGAAAAAFPLDSSVFYELGLATATELRAAGFNWDYAPDLDVASDPLNPVIGVRSLHESPYIAARIGSQFAQGLEKKGVIPCVKHFPGHGDTSVDSHLSLPVIDKTIDQLSEIELVPFRRAVAENIKSVMIAHISFPKITRNPELPSSLSKDIVDGLLRKRLGYKGLVVTDCLEMEAVSEGVGVAKGSVMALQAGNDVVMICHRYDRQTSAIKAVREAVASGALNQTEIENAFKKVVDIKKEFLIWDDVLNLPSPPENSTTQNGKLAQAVYEASTTVVRDESQVIPLKLPSKSTLLLLSPQVTALNQAVDIVKSNPFNVIEQDLTARGHKVKHISYDSKFDVKTVAGEAAASSTVFMITADAHRNTWQADVAREVTFVTTQKVVHIAAGGPYDLMEFKGHAKTYLATYEYTAPALRSAMRVLFGEVPAKGRLPVSIPGVSNLKAVENLWTVEPWIASQDAFTSDDIRGLWNDAFPSLPMSDKLLFKILASDPCYHPRHLIIRRGGKAVGFAATYIIASGTPEARKYTGNLGLLMVASSMHKQGVGLALHEAALKQFRQQQDPEVETVQLGSVFPRFFPGLSQALPDNSTSTDFFIHRGWNLPSNASLAYDYIYKDLTGFKAPADAYTKAANAGVQFTTLKEVPELADDLRRFQWVNFAENAGWPDGVERSISKWCQDIVVGHKDGKVVAALLAFGPVSQADANPICSELAFMEAATGSSKVGGIACVGVDSSIRRAGLGLSLMYKGMEELESRGCDAIYVDWVAIDGFYERLGFHRWDTSAYKCSWMNL